jgi:hypothetical protein
MRNFKIHTLYHVLFDDYITDYEKGRGSCTREAEVEVRTRFL